MEERASAQLCLSGKGEKAPLWKGRKEDPASLYYPLGCLLLPTPKPRTHPVSPSPCRKITWKRNRVTNLQSVPVLPLLAEAPASPLPLSQQLWLPRVLTTAVSRSAPDTVAASVSRGTDMVLPHIHRKAPRLGPVWPPRAGKSNIRAQNEKPGALPSFLPSPAP